MNLKNILKNILHHQEIKNIMKITETKLYKNQKNIKKKQLIKKLYHLKKLKNIIKKHMKKEN